MQKTMIHTLSSWAGRHSVWAFLVLTFGWTWFWWGIEILIGLPVGIFGVFGPAIAAWFLSRKQYTF